MFGNAISVYRVFFWGGARSSSESVYILSDEISPSLRRIGIPPTDLSEKLKNKRPSEEIHSVMFQVTTK